MRTKKPDIINLILIKDGKKYYKDLAGAERSIKYLSDGEYIETIKKYYRQRTVNQNAFYWSAFLDAELIVLHNEGWHFRNKEHLHDWNKLTFNTESMVNKITGEIQAVIKSTSENNTVEMEDFMERIRQEMRESYNSELPYPVII
jgi:hypothetical protein